MECLKSQLLVLRHIAFFRPNAHLAFLYHKPYEIQYNNDGQKAELFLDVWNWVIEECGIYKVKATNKENGFHVFFEQSPYFENHQELYINYENYSNMPLSIYRCIDSFEGFPNLTEEDLEYLRCEEERRKKDDVIITKWKDFILFGLKYKK